MGILRQSARLRSQMVSGPPCMINNDLTSFELSILQGVKPVGIPIFRSNSYFCPIFGFYSYFLTKFLLQQRFRTKTTILLNKDLNSAQILRIYLHICLLLLGAAPQTSAVCKKPCNYFCSYLVKKFKLERFSRF